MIPFKKHIQDIKLFEPGGEMRRLEKLIKVSLFSLSALLLTIGFSYAEDSGKEALVKGIEFGQSGKSDEAIDEFTRALKINPNYAEAYYNRGLTHDQMGKSDQAISDYSKAIETNPDYAEAYYNRGYDYIGKSELDKAMADFSRTLEIDPNDSEAYNQRGLVYVKKGNLDQAIADFNAAVRTDPRSAGAYNNRAVVYYMKKDYARCWDDAHKAQALGYRVAPELLESLERVVA